MNTSTRLSVNTKSIRFRLTLWYSLAFFVATAIVFTSFYFLTRRSLFSQTDATLTSHGSKVVEVLTRDEPGCQACQMMARDAFLREFSEIPGMVVILMDYNGNIVGSSLTIDRSDRVLRDLFDQATIQKEVHITDHIIAGNKLRFWVSPVYRQDLFSGVVFVAHPIDVIEKSLSNLLLLLLGIFLLFLFPTVLGGYLLARSAMQPIASMSQKLMRITSENLKEHIPLPQTNDEVKELAVSFNRLLTRLSQAFKRERQFIGDVAHELKTPLSTQRSTIEVILSKKRQTQDYKKALEDTLSDNMKITSTLQNILDLAWSSTESAKTHKEEIQLTKLVEDLCDFAVKMAHAKNISVKKSIEPNIFIYGIREKLFRAFVNIIDNAVKYTPEKGTIAVTLEKINQEAHVIVQDTGIGISRKDLPHVFKRFYRSHQSLSTLGYGLGLSIVKGIIYAHKGNVSIKSQLGKGTTVTVSLPLAKTHS